MKTEQGEYKLIETLYKKHYALLKNRANKFVNDTDISEDIVQDCFVNAIRSIGCIKDLDDMKQKAYMIKTVDNLSKNYLTRRKERIIFFEDENILKYYAESAEDTEKITEEILLIEKINKELEALRPRDSRAIELKYIRCMSDSEIAPILGIKEDSVRMTVRRSVLRLRKKLGVIRKHEPIQ